MSSTIEKKITDMSIFGVKGNNRWAADIIIKNDKSINVHGTYFPTKKQAKVWLKEQTI